MPSFEEIRSAKQSISRSLLRKGVSGHAIGMGRALRVSAAVTNAAANVHAVGVGRKIVNGSPTDQMCVRIYVVQKLPPSLTLGGFKLPERIDGIPTDVIEAPPAFAARRSRATSRAASAAVCSRDRRRRQRPVMAGISVAHFNVTAGTIAAFCRSVRHGDDPNMTCVLSNNHVFADTNQASLGDDLYQPGPMDGGTIADHFADLLRFKNIVLDGHTPNKVDAAISTVREGIEVDPTICSIGRVTGVQDASEDLEVRKHGRTTGLTEGIVSDISYDAIVGMDHHNPNIVALFADQIRIECGSRPFGLGGDSGSLVVTKSKANAVGLYFAGPDDGSYGIANKIKDVLEILEIQLI